MSMSSTCKSNCDSASAAILRGDPREQLKAPCPGSLRKTDRAAKCLAGDDRRRIIAATQGSLSPVFSFGRNWTEGSELDGRMTKGDETGLDCQDS
ncbi:hypothetical protein TgHK011_005097 [Trichoderma gracile]|nr:hypothetical protein TgHK011_005097 [Trichoderma gracile]